MNNFLHPHSRLYALSDYLFALLSWSCFYIFRKFVVEQEALSLAFVRDSNFCSGLLLVPLVWMFLYFISDSYRSIYRMSRMTELWRALRLSIIGSVLLFFSLILDDFIYYVNGYKDYYLSFFGLLSIHSFFLVGSRLLLLSRASKRIKAGKVEFRTIFIGNSPAALNTYKDIEALKKPIGYRFLGYLSQEAEEAEDKQTLDAHLPRLGSFEKLAQVLDSEGIEEVILALDRKERRYLRKILEELEGRRIVVKVIPDMYDIVLGKVKMSHIYGAILIEIDYRFMPLWFQFLKRFLDIFVSALVLLLALPLYAYIAWRVRHSSSGPIFYKQERIGLLGKPFFIYKFRSMYTDAEDRGPQLASDEDNRCTPWGKIMRKYRLDELPQFWNVLRGDMSLVGPRPERQYYIDKIAARAPQVKKLHRVRPGITSWGQVKYGYASNVDEMVQRLKYDLLYIENISLSLDIKILFYTVLVIVQGRGK